MAFSGGTRLKAISACADSKTGSECTITREAMTDEYLCGIIEGFYGQPWQPHQRLDLFQRLQSLGLNAYIYGPKDDDKHRNYWRDLYTESEALQLKQLIVQAKSLNINFIYALSPGLDIQYVFGINPL